MNEPVIVLDKLSKRFGDVQAVREVSLTIAAGTIFGFLGANGSYDAMYAVVLTVAFLGFAADRGYQMLMNRMLQWREQTP